MDHRCRFHILQYRTGQYRSGQKAPFESNQPLFWSRSLRGRLCKRAVIPRMPRGMQDPSAAAPGNS
uniref:Uncharacterized protein n=1 Tax=virus sp. ctJLD79 TaxID=2827987 RepID=A0A8S5RE88_9VIRU|nr:MAG TPA: hypothetical protein [virus sp. ctJLD79]